MDLHPLPTKTTYYARMSSRKEFTPGWPHDESMARFEFLARPRLGRHEKRKLKQRNFNREKDVRTQTHAHTDTHMMGKGMKCVGPNPFMNRAKAEHGRLRLRLPLSQPLRVASTLPLLLPPAMPTTFSQSGWSGLRAPGRWLVCLSLGWLIGERTARLGVFCGGSPRGECGVKSRKVTQPALVASPTWATVTLALQIKCIPIELRRTWAWLGMRSRFNRIDNIKPKRAIQFVNMLMKFQRRISINWHLTR